MVNLQNYLRIKQAAEFIGVSESTLRNWERNGKITTYRHPISRYRLYRQEDLEALLREIERSAKSSVIRKQGQQASEKKAVGH